MVEKKKNNLVCIYNSCDANKEYYRKNKEARLAYGKQYYKDNLESKKEYAKNYAKINKGYCRAKESLREQRTKQATPKWIKSKDLELIYTNCPKDCEVDHIIPISHKEVCGLNVPWNLQYLTPKQNKTKRNYFDGTVNNDSWKKKNGD